MDIAILDPSAGISGDMTLGALLDIGVERSWLEGLPRRLGFADVGVLVSRVERSSVAATKVDFDISSSAHHDGAEDAHHGHHVGELIDRVKNAPVSGWVRERAVRAFELVGEAEGRVHGVAPDRVHLHEVGAVDAILDIVGAIEGFEKLGVSAIYNLPVAVGTGWVSAAHGQLAVPAPATAILLEGMDVVSGGPIQGEATTPTGAALLRVLSEGSPPPHWRLGRVAWGAGTRDPEHYPNTLRLMLGELAEQAGVVTIVATDLDDMEPEYLEPLRAELFKAGALDCAVWPTQGKKGRISFRVEVQTPQGQEGPILEALFRHSSTAGARSWTATRKTLPRHFVEVEMAPSVGVRVKIRDGPNGLAAKPEYDDVIDAASRLGQPAIEVARRAREAALSQMSESKLGSEGKNSE